MSRQTRLIDEIDELVRRDLRLEEPEEPDDLLFSGFPIDWSSALLAYRAYHEHGVLPFAGGSLEQPAWWWDIVGMIDRIYYIRWWENRAEAEAANG